MSPAFRSALAAVREARPTLDVCGVDDDTDLVILRVILNTLASSGEKRVSEGTHEQKHLQKM